ncbi:hypothetical protein CARUB_v10018584mg [Capsella rubella]|uniref:Prolamin-like domain-containing protein n=1 Tax=Capsella rubella TaxID=81985 RepID=R0H7I6_9BRAS|nr:hypothetical protein CARUB_v10018584mg [Capsella rubella]
MQRMLTMLMIALVIMLSIFTHATGNDLAPAPAFASGPESEQRFLPRPKACLHDVQTIPKCVNAVKHFRFHKIDKECCNALLSLPGDCFGYIFPARSVIRFLLKLACKILSHIR